MLSLLEMIEKLRHGESATEIDLRSLQSAGNTVEQFLAHTAMSFRAMHAAHGHLADALRAIDYADSSLLQTYIDLSKLVGSTADVPTAAIKYGLTLVKRGQFAPAFDAFAQATLLDRRQAPGHDSDPSLWDAICAAYADASHTLGRSVHPAASRDGPVRVGYLTSSLIDGSPTERLLSGWLRHANSEMATLRVYCTDIAAKSHRFALNLASIAQSSQRTGAKIIEDLKAGHLDPWLAPLDADAVQTARMLTERLVRDGTELLLIDAHLGDAAIGMSVAGKPVGRQIALDRGESFPIAGIDEVISLHERLNTDGSALAERGIPSRALFQGIDLDNAPAASRRDFGLSPDAVVLLTHLEAQSEPLSNEFVKMAVRLLADHPRAVFLFTGEVDEKAVRSIFDDGDVGKRVAFASKLRNIAPLIGMCDLYVASFPYSSREGVLTAMNMSKPVMILAGKYDRSNNATLVGAPHAVVGSTSTLFDRCAAMMRDAELRSAVGEILHRRAGEKFDLRLTIDGLMQVALGVIATRQVRAAPTKPQEAGPSSNAFSIHRVAA